MTRSRFMEERIIALQKEHGLEAKTTDLIAICANSNLIDHAKQPSTP